MELNRQQKDNEQKREIHDKLVLVAVRYYWEESRFSRSPIMHVSLRNNSDDVITRVVCHATVKSRGRQVAWVDDDFNFEIVGGLEPGESQTWNWRLNQFSDWGNVPKHRDDLVTTARIVKIEGKDEITLFDEDEIENVETQLSRSEELLQSLTPANAVKAEEAMYRFD